MEKRIFKKLIALILVICISITIAPVRRVEAFAPTLILVPAIGGTVIAVSKIAIYTFTTVVVIITVGNACRVYRQDDARSRFLISENLPKNGTPNSTSDLKSANGQLKQRRWYDGKGNAIKDIDYTDHNNPKAHPNPHQHDWTNGVRSKIAKPLNFFSGKVCNDKYCKYEIFN